ncbi:hypothetical protein G4Y79_24070 [Phototrophicus methaneseepsis]|uniref:SD-repeat containing protein B domain-containing protein n=1 Tax=Phototrophicus methaneseepsis TaxID=2710758 RepID=A0A7S8IFA0_9CHLR|nr:SdrD B-like domain-containing protein [Phototrophicus methaneseepsis]QPC82723.1 hypothetical protein G4Y79_24070 [Phototrophicus methaneseepsis]
MNRTIRKMIQLGLLVLLLAMSTTALAQEGDGQLCVRAFEDRNRNGIKEAGEPFLVDGISANLLNEDGIIINTALLSQSQRKSEGLVCFQRLTPGVYTVQVISADYVPTSAEQVTLTIGESSIPEVFEYGAELLVVDAPTTTTAEGPRSLDQALTPALLQRVLVASIASAVVMGFFIVIGVLVWFLVLRPRRQPRPVTGAYAPVPGTGTYQPVPGTDNYPPASPPSSGRFRPVTPPTGTMTVVPDVETSSTTYDPDNDVDVDDLLDDSQFDDDDVERYQPPT